jgi:site-specific recombinase XerD
MDTFTLMRLAGHSRIETTRGYIHMTDDRARKILENT